LIAQLLPYAIAPWFVHGFRTVRLGACRVVSSALARRAPVQSLLLLPFVVYRLQYERDPDVQSELFYTVPTFAVDIDCVPYVQRCLQPLLDTGSTQPLAVRLMQRLWQQQTRLFPRLSALLDSYAPQQALELKLAIAASVRDVCQHRPEKGAELVSTISRIVTQERHPSVLAMAIDSLVSLCDEDVLEFETAWSVLSRAFTDKQLHDLVLCSWLRFLACGAREADEESGERKEEGRKKEVTTAFFLKLLELYSSIVQLAWSYTKYTSKQQNNVRDADDPAKAVENTDITFQPSTKSDDNESSVRREAYRCLAMYAERSLVFFVVPTEHHEEDGEEERETNDAGVHYDIADPKLWTSVLSASNAIEVQQQIERLMVAVMNAQTAARGAKVETEAQGKAAESLSALGDYLKRFHEVRLRTHRAICHR
jgi:hypothetical protein